MKTQAKTKVVIMTAIAYVRVSSQDQINGTSLDEQLDACARYCVENNIQLLRVFREEGVSAKSINREKFLEAVEFCRKKKVDAFVVYKSDRFARNMQDHYAVKSTLVKYGTKLHSVTEKFTSDATGKLLEGMMACIAEFDNDIRKQRCSSGMLGRLKKGVYPWQPPVGYLCEQNKKHDRKKENPDPIDPVNFGVVQRTLKHFATRPFVLTDVANMLKKEGLVTQRKGIVDTNLVDRMLTVNLQFYAGILKNPFYPDAGEESYKGIHEAMITEEEMLAIQKNRTGRKMRKDPEMDISKKVPFLERYNENFPLKGTLFCAECEHKLTGSSSRGNGGLYSYYHCSNSLCVRKGKALAKKDVEANFIAYIKNITPKKEFLELFRTRIIDEWNAKGRVFDKEIKMYEKSLDNLQERKSKVITTRKQGECSYEQYIDRLNEIGNTQMITEISVHEGKIEWFDIETAVIYATTFIGNLSRTWFDLPREMRPTFQKLIFPEGILIDKDKTLRTTPRFKIGNIYKLIDQAGQQENKEFVFVPPEGIEPSTVCLKGSCSTD